MSAPHDPDQNRGWSRETRDRSFYYALAASALAVVLLFWPFLDVIAYAAVVATVTTPLHRQITRRLGGNRHVGAVVTTLLVAVLLVWPIVLLLYQFALEGVALARMGLGWVGAGNLDVWLDEVRRWWNSESMEAVRAYVPAGTDPVESLLQGVTGALNQALGAVSGLLPRILEALATTTIDLVLFIFTVIVLLADGRALRSFVFDLTPLDNRYEDRLAEVFREFATNVVVGAFVVAAAQGIVATIGYTAFGLARALFFGVITGVCSFIPMVGTALVAVPMVAWTWTLYGPVSGIGMLLYAVIAIGGIDNIIRPLVIRGSTNTHPLLIFFAVFGGLSWMGLPGVLIGPVVVAAFLALATLHKEQTAEAAQRAQEDAAASQADGGATDAEGTGG